ncbi:MAG: hypothetical protein ABMA64_33260 [Myxococcota bacterium]
MSQDEQGKGELTDRLARAVRRWMSRSRSGFGKAAQTGRSQLELRQLNKDLDHFWTRLGKTAFRLVEAGEIDHPALRKAMERIEELEAKIDAARGSAAGSARAAGGASDGSAD